MCYLIAKRNNERGCIAVKAEQDKALAALVTYLNQRTLGKGIEIITVSDIDTFGEYKPYTIISSEGEFIANVLKMSMHAIQSGTGQKTESRQTAKNQIINNPYAARLNEVVSFSISRETMDYFREQSQQSGIPLQTLINACLTNFAAKKKELRLSDSVTNQIDL